MEREGERERLNSFHAKGLHEYKGFGQFQVFTDFEYFICDELSNNFSRFMNLFFRILQVT